MNFTTATRHCSKTNIYKVGVGRAEVARWWLVAGGTVIYVWTERTVSCLGIRARSFISTELTWNLIRFPVRVFITQIADHAQQQPAREQYQPALAWSGLSPPPADDGGRQSCDIHPSLSSLNTLPSMWQRRITSHSHQLECSRHPFINIQHTIFIKFQTFRKILNIIRSSDGLFENSKYDIGSLLSVNCMSQPVQLKGCPVLLKFTYSDPVCFTDNTQDWLCVFFQLTFIRRFHNAEILFDKLLHLWVIWHEQVSTALTYDILMKANLQTEAPVWTLSQSSTCDLEMRVTVAVYQAVSNERHWLHSSSLRFNLSLSVFFLAALKLLPQLQRPTIIN